MPFRRHDVASASRPRTFGSSRLADRQPWGCGARKGRRKSKTRSTACCTRFNAEGIARG